MTEIAAVYLGSIKQDSELAARVEKAETVLEISLQPADRNKGRILAQTSTGEQIGIITDRHRSLDTGDVFFTESGRFVLLSFPAEKVLAVHFEEGMEHIDSSKLILLGHLLGNQHYQIKIAPDRVYIRTSGDSKVIRQQIASLELPGVVMTTEDLASIEGMTAHSHSHH